MTDASSIVHRSNLIVGEAVGEAVGAERLTLRSVGLGIAVAVTCNFWIDASRYVVRSSWVEYGFIPTALIGVFLVLVALVNPALKAVRPGAGLTPTELLVVLCLGLAGCAYRGAAGILGIVASPYYFASPENQWDRYIHPYLPQWLIPTDRSGAMKWFFEGLPEGAPWPWQPWVSPLFWWMLPIAAMAVVSICLNVILRRQWAEHERLSYPLVGVALELIEGADADRRWPPFLRGRLFWAGFAVAFGTLAWNVIAYFAPATPTVPLTGSMFAFGKGFPPVYTLKSAFAIGFAYFANLEVLFSIWFFFVFYTVQVGILNRLGVNISFRPGLYPPSLYPIGGWECFGAFCVFVLWGLYVARGHLKDAVMAALGRRGAEDRGELISFRAAFWGVVLGWLVVVGWLVSVGLRPFLAFFVTGVGLLIAVGVTRIVVESGLMFVSAPVGQQDFTMLALGSNGMTPSSLVALGFSRLAPDFLGPFSHVVRWADFLRGNRRRLLVWTAVSMAVGATTTLATTFYLPYREGASNFGWEFRAGSHYTFLSVVSEAKDPAPPDWRLLLCFGVGAVTMSLLTFMRYRFPWWPLHPIGYTVASTNIIRNFVLSIFIGWACKYLIVRFGGVTFYRRARPFFLGLIAGHVAAVIFSFLIDVAFFPGAGHRIHPWIEPWLGY
ncbi:MAG: hypothetical protein A3F84_04480 [Candidatus Handelsmanbacteria bacterium RIFCSPLOWO2_12_FULL_64_10]|uniref:Uncharacterized protein n=1 Tax=Handelsmanbacteria sp. (strain RIFCSPLOWO2_12_FULL_64_10) TaxID=1817868 RepID=A0A1F6D1T1_HANXR|nr:MAG: hypothetical protein A3F84_04480 [Candidatus Handelsmanbacteria bacterium RIFCSPLOWO2_12_FULL_64_10]